MVDGTCAHAWPTLESPSFLLPELCENFCRAASHNAKDFSWPGRTSVESSTLADLMCDMGSSRIQAFWGSLLRYTSMDLRRCFGTHHQVDGTHNPVNDDAGMILRTLCICQPQATGAATQAAVSV